jgi:ubiquinone/menaquinone biosynthesis C-methylase UbiE
MMASDRLTQLRGIYDERAPMYDQDNSFHAKQAADYLKWMSLKSGHNVLDLACGTGAITVPASQAVGPSGIVIGVDISPASLEVARAKAKKTGAQINFLEHDISNLQGLDGIKEDTFDVITCASAFMLLEDPGAAVKSWAKLLRRGGRIIYDVPTGDSNIQALLLERVASKMGTEVIYPRANLDSMQKVTQLLADAGLDTRESCVADNYQEPEELDVRRAGKLFEEMLSKFAYLFFISARSVDELNQLLLFATV